MYQRLNYKNELQLLNPFRGVINENEIKAALVEALLRSQHQTKNEQEAVMST